jgi:hypothetical protein
MDIWSGEGLCGVELISRSTEKGGPSAALCLSVDGQVVSLKTRFALFGPAVMMMFELDHEHPVVDPHVSHFMQVPLRTSVKLPHSEHISPS